MIAQPSIVDSAQKRVVIVDDDDLFRESLGLNLSEEGYQVVDFDNGEDALTFLLGGQQTDVVLLDWRMPVMDGLGVLRRLRETWSSEGRSTILGFGENQAWGNVSLGQGKIP